MKKILLFIALILVNWCYAQDWIPVGANNVDGFVYCTAGDTNMLYVGGTFNNPANNMTEYDGSSFSNMSIGVLNDVRAMEFYNNDLYVGGDGEMLSSGDGLAMWDGSSWSDGANIGGNGARILAMEVYNGKLYVAMSGYTSNPAATLYEWDGSTRTTIDYFTGTSNRGIYSMAVHGGELYVGGFISGVFGGITAENIVKWDGSTWSTVGDTGSTDGKIYSLASYGGFLYAGGSFSTIDGISADNLVRWDGSIWSAVGTGTDGDVEDMFVFNNDLYVGGNYTLADGVSCSNIARYDGINFHSVGTGTNSIVRSIGSYNGELFIGGYFTQAGGASCNYIAKYGFYPNYPSAEFSSSDISVCINNSISFYDLSTDTPITWLWTFTGGAPNISTSQNPVITYDSVGMFDVKLVVTNVDGSDSLTKNGYITVNPLPTANAGLDTNICFGSSTNLSASGGISYSWSPTSGLDDPNILNPSASPTTTTTYTVTVTDGNGCSNPDVVIITVISLPSVSFSGLNTIYCENASPVILTGSPSGGTFDGIGIVGNQFNPSAGVGTYSITYFYTDGNGCTNLLSQDVTVSSLPTVSFSGLGSNYCIDDPPITLVGSPSGGIFSGVGITGDQFNPADIGIQTIIYTYTDSNGCMDSSNQDVTIDICTGVNKTIVKDFLLFPNPNNGKFILKIIMHGNIEISITDIVGQRVFFESFEYEGDYRREFNMEKYDAGIYLLQIKTNSSEITKRIINR